MMITHPEKKLRRPESVRDLSNFINLRPALPGDDLSIAELLTNTFLSTYKKKLPAIETSEERKAELRDVALRRRSGYVSVAELGYRIIGTFSLIHPESPLTDAWRPNGATLRCVAIDPEFHGLELSSILLEEADRIAGLWKSSALFLHVQKGANKVASLYEKFGYVRDCAGDKIAHGYELLGYVKDLNRAEGIHAN